MGQLVGIEKHGKWRDAPLSQTEMSPAEGVEPPEVASVIMIFLEVVLFRVARRALSISSDSAYGRGERPCITLPASIYLLHYVFLPTTYKLSQREIERASALLS